MGISNKDENINLYSEKEDFINKQDISINKLLASFYNLDKINYEINNSFLRNKIFSRVANKDHNFNRNIMKSEKFINRLFREYKLINKEIKLLEYTEDIDEEKRLNIYENINNIASFQKSIRSNLEEINKKYFGHLKIATVNICMNKTNQELEILHTNLNNYLQEFKNLNEAAEYIFFNSGQLILTTIDSLIKILPKDNYDLKYFLPSDVIITLELKEWIDLYNKIRFVLKNEKVNNKEFENNYLNFEIYYLILMMNMEVSKNQIKNFKI